MAAFALVPMLWYCDARPGVESGHVEGWGENRSGQTVPPPGIVDVIAVAAGKDHSLALRANGRVVAWGDNTHGKATVPAGLSNVVAISAASHSVALKSDGTLVIWGSNQSVVTTVPANATDIKAVSAGSGASGNLYTVAVRTDGSVVAWGLPSGTETEVPIGLGGVVEVTAGSYHVLALKEDGTVTAWGLNTHGQATPPDGLTDVVAVRAGQFGSFALKADGTVVKWGRSDDTDLPDGLSGGVTDLQVGSNHVIAWLTDGTILAWGQDGFDQTDVPPGLSGVLAISAQGNHSLVLTRRPLVLSISPPVLTDVGANVTFEVAAAGEDLSYQWQLKGMDLVGETSPTLLISAVDPSDAGMYRVVVRNPFGSATASTRLSLPPPTVVADPEPVTLYRGETAIFEVEASGFEPFSYQWLFNGAILPGANEATLSVPNLRAVNAGEYAVIVTDTAGGSQTSGGAILTFIDPTRGEAVLLPDLDTSIGGLNPKGTATVLSGTRKRGATNRGLLRFDLSTLPSAAQVHSARVMLTVVQIPRSPPSSVFGLHRMLTAWGPDATWLNASPGNAWSEPGGLSDVDFRGDSSASQNVTGLGMYEFGPSSELASDIQTWLEVPDANQGWLLRSESEDVGQSARHFAATESGQPPQLHVSYTIPPAMPRLTEFTQADAQLRFQLQGEPGRVYRVEYRAQVNSGIWTTVTNIAAGAGINPLLLNLPIEAGQRFFRVLVE